MGGHEFEQTLGHSQGQGSLACCSPRCRKELDVGDRLSNNKWAREGMLSKPEQRRGARLQAAPKAKAALSLPVILAQSGWPGLCPESWWWQPGPGKGPCSSQEVLAQLLPAEASEKRESLCHLAVKNRDHRGRLGKLTQNSYFIWGGVWCQGGGACGKVLLK